MPACQLPCRVLGLLHFARRSRNTVFQPYHWKQTGVNPKGLNVELCSMSAIYSRPHAGDSLWRTLDNVGAPDILIGFHSVTRGMFKGLHQPTCTCGGGANNNGGGANNDGA